MNTTASHSARVLAAPRGLGDTLRARLERAAATLHAWQERARQRRDLASLTAHELRDLGISAGDARMEASKPFWQA